MNQSGFSNRWRECQRNVTIHLCSADHDGFCSVIGCASIVSFQEESTEIVEEKEGEGEKEMEEGEVREGGIGLR